jgi:hypothetical protein
MAVAGRRTVATVISPAQVSRPAHPLARKLGVGSVPMSACLVAIEATPGDPAAAPWTAGAWRVTSAVYSPCTIPLTRVVAVKPSICIPPATGLVTVQVRCIRHVQRQYQRVSAHCRGSAGCLGRELPSCRHFRRPVDQAIEIVDGHEIRGPLSSPRALRSRPDRECEPVSSRRPPSV